MSPVSFLHIHVEEVSKLVHDVVAVGIDDALAGLGTKHCRGICFYQGFPCSFFIPTKDEDTAFRILFTLGVYKLIDKRPSDTSIIIESTYASEKHTL